MSTLALEIAGFLSMLSQGTLPPNWQQQAKELSEKLGDKLAHGYPVLD